MKPLLYVGGFVATFVTAVLLLRQYSKSRWSRYDEFEDWAFYIGEGFILALVWPVAVPVCLLGAAIWAVVTKADR